MISRSVTAGLVIVASLCAGCHTDFAKVLGTDRPGRADCCDAGTVRIKAPPQKVVIECPDAAPECAPELPPICAPVPKKPESKPEPKQPEREGKERRPEPEAGRGESALGTLAALGQVASLTRTTAMTSSLATVNPGTSSLGIGIQWIQIPIPFPRLFRVNETPSVTVPLSEASLQPVGFGGAGVDPRLAGCRGLSREELAALVAQELAARGGTPRRDDRCRPADDAERRQLEKKLSDAEEQIERLSKLLKALDEKLPGKGAP